MNFQILSQPKYDGNDTNLTSDILFEVIVQGWLDGSLTNTDRISTMITFPLVCTWWREAFTLLSRTYLYIPSPSYCQFYLRQLVHAPKAMVLREQEKEPQRKATMSPRTLCKTLTIRVENAVLPPPLDWHNSPMGEVPGEFLHYTSFHKLVPNLHHIDISYVDITLYQMFFKHSFRKALDLAPIDVDMEVSFDFEVDRGLPEKVIEEVIEKNARDKGVKVEGHKDRWDWPRFLAGVRRMYMRCPTGGPTRPGEVAPLDLEMEITDVDAPPHLIERYLPLTLGFKSLLFDAMFEPHVKNYLPRIK
ncbi:hypothetical protein FA15DRAFT_600759 [Coprinopsis marcescibilis]|uniref:Uncharacterized protein n=1 Tax=Coprinopsis marcescibilis TaxID=230819 RepID=A0A5C3KHZ9_COPMA|nr:hypothetical protein FA15DRAFT_600759 [Coprinopsis marcescibilis]